MPQLPLYRSFHAHGVSPWLPYIVDNAFMYFSPKQGDTVRMRLLSCQLLWTRLHCSLCDSLPLSCIVDCAVLIDRYKTCGLREKKKDLSISKCILLLCHLIYCCIIFCIYNLSFYILTCVMFLCFRWVHYSLRQRSLQIHVRLKCVDMNIDHLRLEK